tara:strand:- start:224 stop:484 length:261 start_codon:yes stop_codon:yes gene_type:complete
MALSMKNSHSLAQYVGSLQPRESLGWRLFTECFPSLEKGLIDGNAESGIHLDLTYAADCLSEHPIAAIGSSAMDSGDAKNDLKPKS